MMQNPREEENFTTHHVVHLYLLLAGEKKHGGKTNLHPKLTCIF